MTTNVFEAVVIDRTGSVLTPIKLATSFPAQLCCSPVWHPRPGAPLAIAGPDTRVSFFERNGLSLPRVDFDAGVKATNMAYSADGALFAVSHEGGVHVWTFNNYQWTCRNVILHNHISYLFWSGIIPNVPQLTGLLKDGGVFQARFVQTSAVLQTSNTAVAAIINGCNIIISDLCVAILPHPMCHGAVSFPTSVTAVCASEHGFAALLADAVFHVVCLKNVTTPHLCASSPLQSVSQTDDLCASRVEYKLQGALHFVDGGLLAARMPVLLSAGLLVVICARQQGASDFVCVYRLSDTGGDAHVVAEVFAEGHVVAVSKSAVAEQALVYATSCGKIGRLHVSNDGECVERREFIEGFDLSDVVAVSEFSAAKGRCFTLLRGRGGKLQVVEIESGKKLLVSMECTSYVIHEGFLSFTTSSHLLYCVLLDQDLSRSFHRGRALPSLVDALDVPQGETEEGIGARLAEGEGATRPIDRGSLIVSAVPGDVSIVLQAPRGNLETIAPRPVVFEAVSKHAKKGVYDKAFGLCRRQRVDMNHIVDADYDLFMSSVAQFVKQVDKESHLNVFLTFLKGDKGKINAVCDAVVNVLREGENFVKYVTTILTALIRRDPSDVEGALMEVRKANARGYEQGNAAIDYLFVLMKNETSVYEYALGTYDLKLALFVAQSSQMNPTEYLQELADLEKLDSNVLKYTIDLRLERYDSALRHLHASGKEKHVECVAFAHKHALYKTGLQLFCDDDAVRSDLFNGFGKHLQKCERFEEAAVVFMRNGDLQNASLCYAKGGHWQLAVGSLSKCDLSMQEKEVVYCDISDDLVNRGLIKEAATVKVSLLGDVDGAIEILINAEEWEAAFEAVAIHKASLSAGNSGGETDAWGSVAEGVVEGYDIIVGTIRENSSKLRDRRNRLVVVRETKRVIQERLEAKGVHEEGETDSDVFSASTASSFASNLSDVTFMSKTSVTSVYNSLQTGPLSSAKLEKQAEKRKRKAAKKRIREGHPREEEALVGYLKKLIPGEFFTARVSKCVRALLYVGRADLVATLVKEMETYVQEALLLPDEILGQGRKELTDNREWLVGEIALVL